MPVETPDRHRSFDLHRSVPDLLQSFWLLLDESGHHRIRFRSDGRVDGLPDGGPKSWRLSNVGGFWFVDMGCWPSPVSRLILCADGLWRGLSEQARELVPEGGKSFPWHSSDAPHHPGIVSSAANPRQKFFEEAHGNVDGRFSGPALSQVCRLQRLRVLLQGFSLACQEAGVRFVLMHGSLIGWHWNERILPWDNDIDICLFYEDVPRLGLEATWYSGHWPLRWEVNPNYRDRGTRNRQAGDNAEPNKIDARLIDPLTGVFMDVTALAELRPGGLSTKCPHHYRRQDILPLQRAQFEEIPVWVPNNVVSVLAQEYGTNAIHQPSFGGYCFDRDRRVWIRAGVKLSNPRDAVELSPGNAPQWFEAASQAVQSTRPGRLAGCGITICGGGWKYIPGLWVTVRMLRQLGCSLPIQVWHLGREELPQAVESLLTPLGVECVDALAVRERYPSRILNGWELKPYAILHSPFAQVLALDADNVPVVDPTYLFDSPQYKAHGAIFWPDYQRLGEDREIWRLTGVSFRDEAEFETGQILVDKRRCHTALSLTMRMNEYSDFWYQFVHGDKETFHIAWRKLDQPYAMPEHPIQTLTATMCQHDFEGRRLFQHRNLHKWTLDDNPRIPGFLLEERCLGFLAELRSQLAASADMPAIAHRADVAGRSGVYERVGYDQRDLYFAPDGVIGPGAGGMERSWTLIDRQGLRVLKIYGDCGLTAELTRQDLPEPVWHGRWLQFEKMPVTLRFQ